MICKFTYSLHYGGHTLSWTKDMDIPAFPHKQMMLIDGDVELDLEEKEALRHYTSIMYYCENKETSVCVEDYTLTISLEELVSIIKTYDGSKWGREFEEAKVQDIMGLISRRDAK